MPMDKINELIEALGIDTNIQLEDIPTIDLYMDQVIQLFEKKFSETKRNEDEKVLTKTMINNYAKGKLFFPIKNKKYSRDHLLMISLIYQLKGALSIGDIKASMEPLNHLVTGDESFSLEEFYKEYIQLTKINGQLFREEIQVQAEAIEETAGLGHEKTTEMEKVLFILSFAQMSNLYRRAAEKMVDELVESKEKK